MTLSRVLAVALALLMSPAALGQEPQDHPSRPDRPDRAAGERANPRGEQHPQGPGVLALLPPDSTTEHTLEADGVKLAYTATAGTLNLYEQSGERTAAIFYTAYVLKESFGQLWSYQHEGWARRFFDNWRAALKWQRLKPYETFAAMIDRHWDGIAAYCKPENKVSLGFVEGLNNKIRVFQRRAYGLRDEEYLRLKVLTCMLPPL